jgi:hypothetical protein
MGIMNNKITRRVALGSVAGGLAAGALVIRALKGPFKLERLPPSKYEQDWDADLKTTQVPVTRADDRSSVAVQHGLQVGQVFAVVSLSASYDAQSGPAQYPQAPHFYTITSGRLTAISPVVDDARSWSITAEDRLHKSRAFRKKIAGGQCLVALENDGAHFFEVGQALPRRIPDREVNPACAELGTWLDFELPRKAALSVGTKWVGQEPTTDSVPWQFSIVGFVEIAGRRAVEVLAQREFNGQDIAESVKRKARLLKESMAIKNVDLDEAVRLAVEKALKNGETQTHHLTRYIDLQTGVTLRREFKSTTHSFRAPSLNRETIAIDQLLVA